MNLTYLSVCSGMEAATVAWEPLGWKAWAYAEVEPFPAYLLNHHYGSGRPHFMPDPGEEGLSAKDKKKRLADIKSVAKLQMSAFGGNSAPNLGDMTKFKEWPDAVFDVLVGGTPCQSYSVAGLRKGLDDPRGDLMLTYVAIARRYRPRWVAWENVPGVLSDDGGRSFGTLLGLLTGKRIEVPSGGWETAGFIEGYKSAYGVAWRIIDSQFIRVDGFGRAVPQRRRRVFVVGYLGDWRRAAAVLLERESVSGNSPPRRYSGQGVAGTIAASSARRGGVSEGERGGLVPVAGTLDAAGGKSRGAGTPPGMLVEEYVPDIVSQAMSAKWSKGSSGPAGDEVANLVAHAIPIDMRQASRGGTMTNNRTEGSSGGAPGTGIGESGDPSPTIARSHVPAVAFSFKPSHFTRGKDGAPADAFPPLSADADKGDQDALVCAPIAFDSKASGRSGFGVGEISPTLRAMNSDGGHQNGGGQVAVAAFNNTGHGWWNDSEVASGLRDMSAGGGSKEATVIAAGWEVRRLTPIECEALQGFPRGYSNVPWRGQPGAPDGPRYRILGNSMSVNAMRWLGYRIEMVEDIFGMDV